MIDQQRRYTVGMQRSEDGGMDVWLHVEPAFDEGMDSETIAGRWFGSREIADWTDDEALAEAVAWG